MDHLVFRNAEPSKKSVMRLGCVTFKLDVPTLHVLLVHAGGAEDRDPIVLADGAGGTGIARASQDVYQRLLLDTEFGDLLIELHNSIADDIAVGCFRPGEKRVHFFERQAGVLVGIDEAQSGDALLSV